MNNFYATNTDIIDEISAHFEAYQEDESGKFTFDAPIDPTWERKISMGGLLGVEE